MAEPDINKIIAKNITKYLDRFGKTQIDLAAYMDVSQATVSNWCKGLKVPRMDKIDRICNFFEITRSQLMDEEAEIAAQKNTLKAVRIPVVGRVRAGLPIDAVEEILDWEEITPDMATSGDFFGLQVKGDSMVPTIMEGDVVIVRQQDDAECGETVIAIINGDEATVKKLIKYEDGGIALVAANPLYPPLRFTDKEILEKPVRIIGKVVELRRKF